MFLYPVPHLILTLIMRGKQKMMIIEINSQRNWNTSDSVMWLVATKYPLPFYNSFIFKPCAFRRDDNIIHHCEDGACESEQWTLGLTNYIRDRLVDSVGAARRPMLAGMRCMLSLSPLCSVLEESKEQSREQWKRKPCSRWNHCSSGLGSSWFFFLS